MCAMLYDIWRRIFGYVGGNNQEIRKNRNENAKADVCVPSDHKTE